MIVGITKDDWRVPALIGLDSEGYAGGAEYKVSVPDELFDKYTEALNRLKPVLEELDTIYKNARAEYVESVR